MIITSLKQSASIILTDGRILFYEEAVLGEPLHVEDQISRQLRDSEALPAGLHVLGHSVAVVLLDDLEEGDLDGRGRATCRSVVITREGALLPGNAPGMISPRARILNPSSHSGSDPVRAPYNRRGKMFVFDGEA